MSDLRSLLLEVGQGINEKLDRLLQLVGGGQIASEPIEDAAYIIVPEPISDRFRESTNAHLLGCEKEFPLRKYMDAFSQNFKEVSIVSSLCTTCAYKAKAQGTVGIDINLYLKLLKSVWIMQIVKEKSDLPEGSLWERYVTEMDKV